MDSTRIRTLAKVRPSTDCPSLRVETFSTSLENLSSGGADGCGWRDPRSVTFWRSHLNNEALPGTRDCALLCHADPTRERSWCPSADGKAGTRERVRPVRSPSRKRGERDG